MHIRNFAIVEEIDIAFNQGLIIFSGETGAGKSIMVEAVGLILGDRCDSNVIRIGHEQAEVTATFEIDNNLKIIKLLNEQTIEFEKELILRRTIHRDSRSRAYINGTHVPTKLLRSVTDDIVDMHGQHAHLSLLRTDIQREVLDEFGDYPQVLKALKNAWEKWHEIDLAITALAAMNNDDYLAQIKLLEYQIQELEALNIGESEFSQMEREYARLANAKLLLDDCQHAQQKLLEDEHSVQNQVSHILNSLQDMQKFDPSLLPIITLLNSANIEILEAGNELRHYLNKLEIDPERLNLAENQLSAWHDIARKHNIQPDGLADHLQILSDDLADREHNKVRFAELQKLQQSSLEKYRITMMQLSKCRQQAAEKLGEYISKNLHKLGLSEGKLLVNITQMDIDKPLKNGSDKVEYLVSFNSGQPLQPLNKVASGGELSRLSLAIKASAKNSGVPTLIFDEIDSGIGGRTAEIVGNLLHELANNRQIFCVTHLPQIAAQGDHHIQITKISDDNTTVTKINHLNKKQRIHEIARMLGGVNITQQTLAHAKEMLNQ